MGLNRQELAAAIAAHGTVCRVVIAAFQGSTPRETGAAMLVWSGGQSGTIGGGALEHHATEIARRSLNEGPFHRQSLTLPLGPALGQCCGGSVRLLIERLSAAELAEIPFSGLYARPFTPGPAEPPLAVLSVLRQARSQAQAQSRDQPCITAGWFVEPLEQPQTPLWLYGAGHVGRAIVRSLQDLPFRIIWIDTTRDRFPDPADAEILIAPNPADLVTYAPAETIHVVLTYSHALDLELCHRILSRPFAQLHLIGSESKRARFTSRLRSLGHGDAAIQRIICPIGIKSLGKEPAAIAAGLAVLLLQSVARPAEAVRDEGMIA